MNWRLLRLLVSPPVGGMRMSWPSAELEHHIAIYLADPLELVGAEPQIEGQPQRRELLFWRLGCSRGGRKGHSAGCDYLPTLRTSGDGGDACW